MFFTGFARSASNILKDQNARTKQNDDEMLNNLHYVKDLGLRSKKALEEGNAILFGPSPGAVRQRLDDMIPVFARAQPSGDVRRVLSRNGVDAVLVTAADPVWQASAGWVFATPAVYATDRIRVLNVNDLKDRP